MPSAEDRTPEEYKWLIRGGRQYGFEKDVEKLENIHNKLNMYSCDHPDGGSCALCGKDKEEYESLSKGLAKKILGKIEKQMKDWESDLGKK